MKRNDESNKKRKKKGSKLGGGGGGRESKEECDRFSPEQEFSLSKVKGNRKIFFRPQHPRCPQEKKGVFFLFFPFHSFFSFFF